MKIISLEAENFKRLKAVRIEPDGSLCEITGRNSAGKSSVLDAIEATLAGKASSPDEPIRHGEERARVVLDLGEIVVKRKWTKAGSQLSVETRDGMKPASPQAMLDRLFHAIAFDPLAFAAKPEREQAETLRRLAGLDFREIDSHRARLYAERTEVNRAIRQQEAKLAGISEIENVGDHEIDIAELTKRQREARKVKQECDRAIQSLNESESYLQKIERRIAEVKGELDQLLFNRQGINETIDLQRSKVNAQINPDMDAIEKAIYDAYTINLRIKDHRERNALASEVDANRAHAERLTGEIESLDGEREAKLSEARFPIDGLTVDGDMVRLDGVPLSQASTSRKIRLGLAVAAELNPKLRVALIRDGSLIDREGMAELGRLAVERDMQFIVERVAGDTPSGVVIEDGEVRADLQSKRFNGTEKPSLFDAIEAKT